MTSATTNESVDDLGIRTGGNVIVVVKAASALRSASHRMSLVAGTVEAVQRLFLLSPIL
jgi:hypothetical protein